MTRFRFRLQRILDWQQRVYQMEDEKLRQRLAEAAATQEKLAELAAKSLAIEQEFLHEPQIAAADLKALAEFRRKTNGERHRLGKDLAARQGAVAEQREKLLLEKRKLQVYERLRLKALAAHTQAADRELEALGLESFLAHFPR